MHVRDELHARNRADFAELADCRGREGGGVRPHNLVPLERESVLHIELEPVVLEEREHVDEPRELSQLGNLAPADVEHKPAHFEIRRVGDFGEPEPPTVGLHSDLAQRLQGELRAALRTRAYFYPDF